jgi:hypothetical protein
VKGDPVQGAQWHDHLRVQGGERVSVELQPLQSIQTDKSVKKEKQG